MAHTVSFWGKKWNKRKQRFETGNVRFQAAGAKPGVKRAAQNAAVGTCKPVKGSPKIKLCKVKASGERQWRFKKKRS